MGQTGIKIFKNITLNAAIKMRRNPRYVREHEASVGAASYVLNQM